MPDHHRCDVRRRQAPAGPLSGVVVLDLATVGPAARCTRLLADYGATVVKVGAVPGRGAEPITPALLRLQRWAAVPPSCGRRPQGRRRPRRLPGPGRPVPTWWSRASGPEWSTGWGSGTTDLAAVNPRAHPVLDHRLRPDRPPGRPGPATTSTTWPWAATWPPAEPRADGGPPVAGATIADAAGGGMQAAMAVMAALIGRGRDGPGTHLDVAVADGVLWLTSLAVDEHLATGAGVGHGHDVITGRYACYDTYQAADGGWLAVGAIEPKFFANLCRLLGCEQWVDHQLDDDVPGQDPGRLPGRLRHQGPRRMGRAAGRRRHLRRPGAGRVARWPTTSSSQPAAPSSRRRGRCRSGRPATPAVPPGGPVLAGMTGHGEPVVASVRPGRPTPTSCLARPECRRSGSAELRAKGVVA